MALLPLVTSCAPTGAARAGGRGPEMSRGGCLFASIHPSEVKPEGTAPVCAALSPWGAQLGVHLTGCGGVLREPNPKTPKPPAAAGAAPLPSEQGGGCTGAAKFTSGAGRSRRGLGAGTLPGEKGGGGCCRRQEEAGAEEGAGGQI